MNAFGAFNIFKAPSRSGSDWFSVGLASSFPEVGSDDDSLAHPRTCNADPQPGCKVFRVDRDDASQRSEVVLTADGLAELEAGADLTDQVLVFQHRGKFHAVDHKCPHSSYPLSQGTPFDIEDFGVALSVGLTCPKHGWSFDVVTGMADHGPYRLKVWEVQLRDASVPQTEGPVSTEKEVWVRRKPRMG